MGHIMGKHVMLRNSSWEYYGNMLGMTYIKLHSSIHYKWRFLAWKIIYIYIINDGFPIVMFDYRTVYYDIFCILLFRQ